MDAQVLKAEIALLEGKKPQGEAKSYCHGMTIETAIELLRTNHITCAAQHLENMIDSLSFPQHVHVVNEAQELLEAIRAEFNLPHHTWGWSQRRGHYDSYKDWEVSYIKELNAQIEQKKQLLKLLE